MTTASRILLFALILLANPLAFAAAPQHLLDQFSQGLKTLDGRFEQQVFDADGQPVEQSGGRVALAAPRQFRWDYEEPFPQTIVADGNQIWIYDPDLEQVTVRNQSHEEQSSPLAALIDPAELQRQFVVADGGESDGLQWVVLTPKGAADEAAFSECRIGFRAGELQRMVMVDNLQQRTEIGFSAWQRNGALAAERFRFVPPPGTDVVGEVVEQAEVYPVAD